MVNVIILISILFLSTSCLSQIILESIEMRPPRRNDFGFFFDLILAAAKNATFHHSENSIAVRGENCCLTNNGKEYLCDGSKIVGGFFENFKLETKRKITIVWPTVTLYNREGYCDIVIKQGNYSKTTKITQRVHFDTNIVNGNYPSIMKEYVDLSTVSNCKTLDLNPFEKCAPVDCEEKYFGQRNFFDDITSTCMAVPNCIGEDAIYDYIGNECVDWDKFASGDHIKNLTRREDETPKIWYFNYVGASKRIREIYDCLQDSKHSLLNYFLGLLLIIIGVIFLYFFASFLFFLCAIICFHRVSIERGTLYTQKDQ